VRQGDWTWSAATRVWWAFAWRAVLVGFLLAFIVGFLVGAAEGALGVGRHPAIVILAGIGCGIPASLWAMRSALKQTYRGFRITFTSAH
jgi:hypothetical protein